MGPGDTASRMSRQPCPLSHFQPPTMETVDLCNNYAANGPLVEWAEAHERFLGRRLRLPVDPSNLTWKNEVWPKYEGLFVRAVDPAEPNGELEPAVGRWGLIPSKHKASAKVFKLSTNNCRSETMAKAWSFERAFARRRCVIPTSWFSESTGPKGSMTRHRITRAGGGPLFLAGLWDLAELPEGPVESYTMVMQEAVDGDDMRPFHSRQPVFLTAENVGTWLNPTADVADVIRAPPPGYLAFDPPSPAAANPA